MSKKIIALAGANGYVGRALLSAIRSQNTAEVVAVTRDNHAALQEGTYDLLINAAMPSKRFWAKQHIAEDYRETVQKTEAFYNNWNYKKFILISTVSARCESSSVYGAHKAEAEKICKSPNDLILRLSAMFSPDLCKGSLIDILQKNKVFVSGQSRYPFASLDFVTSWIAGNLDRTGIVEVGAKNSISLQEIADHLQQDVTFEGPKEDQTLNNPSPEYPDAKEVLKFMDQMAKAGKK